MTCSRVAASVATILISFASSPVLTAQGQVHSPTGNNMFPQWSHDGRLIVFSSDREGDPEVYVMGADGSNARRLTRSPGRDAYLYFSSDDKRIVFQSPRANGEDTNIYVMNADGSGVVQLTHLKGFAGVPIFSPDDSAVAFQWRGTSNFADNTKWRLCIMRANGSDFRVITPGETNDQVPNWSPDGARLIFYSDRSGKNQIYTINPVGGDVRRLLTTESNDNAASWSPDGTKLVFTSDRNGDSEIYVADADGKNVRRLTTTRATERMAVWSPNGQQLVFSSDGDGPSDVYLLNADGSGLISLSRSKH